MEEILDLRPAAVNILKKTFNDKDIFGDSIPVAKTNNWDYFKLKCFLHSERKYKKIKKRCYCIGNIHTIFNRQGIIGYIKIGQIKNARIQP